MKDDDLEEVPHPEVEPISPTEPMMRGNAQCDPLLEAPAHSLTAQGPPPEYASTNAQQPPPEQHPTKTEKSQRQPSAGESPHRKEHRAAEAAHVAEHRGAGK